MSDTSSDTSAAHSFASHPHRTLLALSAPVLVSLAAEPLTGLVDTGFVARLGSDSLAALGVAATLLSTILWVFNFLGIGTQTEVGAALGRGDTARAGRIAGIAMTLGLVLATLLGVVVWPLAEEAVELMGASGEAERDAALYLRIRLLGGPAVLLTMAAFGALRGLQDMKTPLWIALGVNAANLVLDPLLIFGAGPVPRFELAGAAWASTVAQWGGAVACTVVLRRRLAVRFGLEGREAIALLAVGRDLFLRTGSLLLFLGVATRAANELGASEGAAHQALRQLWMVTAFGLDAGATAAQSLVSFFVASGDRALARRVAGVACGWGIVGSAVLAIAMLLGTGAVEALFVPLDARPAFALAWIVCALSQPINGASFLTDGIHWGTADYGYLRNAMFVATLSGVVALLWWPPASASLAAVWITTGAWMAVRAAFGLARIWPGGRHAPLGRFGEGEAGVA